MRNPSEATFRPWSKDFRIIYVKADGVTKTAATATVKKTGPEQWEMILRYGTHLIRGYVVRRYSAAILTPYRSIPGSPIGYQEIRNPGDNYGGLYCETLASLVKRWGYRVLAETVREHGTIEERAAVLSGRSRRRPVY